MLRFTTAVFCLLISISVSAIQKTENKSFNVLGFVNLSKEEQKQFILTLRKFSARMEVAIPPAETKEKRVFISFVDQAYAQDRLYKSGPLCTFGMWLSIIRLHPVAQKLSCAHPSLVIKSLSLGYPENVCASTEIYCNPMLVGVHDNNCMPIKDATNNCTKLDPDGTAGAEYALRHEKEFGEYVSQLKNYCTTGLSETKELIKKDPAYFGVHRDQDYTCNTVLLPHLAKVEATMYRRKLVDLNDKTKGRICDYVADGETYSVSRDPLTRVIRVRTADRLIMESTETDETHENKTTRILKMKTCMGILNFKTSGRADLKCDDVFLSLTPKHYDTTFSNQPGTACGWLPTSIVSKFPAEKDYANFLVKMDVLKDVSKTLFYPYPHDSEKVTTSLENNKTTFKACEQTLPINFRYNPDGKTEAEKCQLSVRFDRPPNIKQNNSNPTSN